MTRPSDPGFDVRISDWLEADPDLAPPDLMRTVESALPSIPQRRVVHLPWRFPPMSTFTKVAVAAVAVIAIGAVGIFALQPRSVPAVGAAPSASPSPSPFAHAFAVRDASANGGAAERNVHVAHQRDLDRASGRAGARKPPPSRGRPAGPTSGEPSGDFVYDPALTGPPVLRRGLPARWPAQTGDQWAADTLAVGRVRCHVPVTIDGAAGLLGDDCNVAAVALDGRGYLVVLHTSGDEPWSARCTPGPGSSSS